MMKTPAFEAAVEVQRDEYRRRFFTSEYGDTATREQSYKMNIALDDLLNSMSAFVFQNESITAAEDEEDDQTN